MKEHFGIRNAAVCPGAVYVGLSPSLVEHDPPGSQVADMDTLKTPIFHPEWCRDRIRPDDFTMTPAQCASVMMRVATEPEFGDGNIIETMMVGTRDEPQVSIREVPLPLLYPTSGPVGEDNHLLEEEKNFVEHVKKHGMRVPYVAPSEHQQTHR